MDTLSGISVFVRTVDARSFSEAGRQLGLSASAVSKSIARLEEKLRVRLLNRTTRSISLTGEGAVFYERCVRIIAEVEDAEEAMGRARSTPQGVLRVDVPVALGRLVIAPAIPSFLARYPEVCLELSLGDEFVDMVTEGLDLQVRMGELKQSGLVSRRLGSAKIVVCGAPAYFAARGTPKTPNDLFEHQAISYLRHDANVWRFVVDGAEQLVRMRHRYQVNNTEALRDAAVAGLGLLRSFDFVVAPEIRSGALRPVLAGFAPPERPILVIYRENPHLSPKVRAFIDHLVDVFGGASRDRVKAPSRKRSRD